MRFDGIPIRCADVLIDLYERHRPQLEAERESERKRIRENEREICRLWRRWDRE